MDSALTFLNCLLEKYRFFFYTLALVWLTLPLTAQSIALDKDAGQETASNALWSFYSGEAALAAGFPLLSTDLYEQALASSDLSFSQRRAARMGWATALLSQNRPNAALEQLEAIVIKKGSAYFLRRALAAYQTKQLARAKEWAAEIQPSELSPSDRAWFLSLSSLIAEAEGETELHDKLLSEAIEAVVSDVQRSQLQILQFRSLLLSEQQSQEDLVTLEAAWKNEGELDLQYHYGKLYALMLFQMEEKAEAAAAIREQLQLLPKGAEGKKASLWLLLALVKGAATQEGLSALQNLLNLDAERHFHLSALHLLAEAAMTQNQSRNIIPILDALITQPQTHPLLDHILYLRATLAFLGGYYKAAEALLSENLLEQFPSSSLRKPALYLLARIAWEADAPEYRTLATYLNNIRLSLRSGEERSLLSVLVGDALFLNGDYINAADTYAVAIREVEAMNLVEQRASWLHPLLFQRTMALLEAGALDDAFAFLDQSIEELGDSIYRWQAEWNSLRKLKAAGKLGLVQDRLKRLFEDNRLSTIPASTLIRFMWMEVEIAVESGDYSQVPERAQNITQMLDGLEPGAIELDQQKHILSRTLLLEAQAYLANANDEASEVKARGAFQKLRSQFPDAESTILSYLIESRFYASNNRLVEAQKGFQALADLYPQSPYAPIALFEAAVAAEQRGGQATAEGPAGILQRIIEEYPEAPLSYYARLRRAAIARSNNRFTDALILYDNLRQQYPDHPQRYRVEIARADTLFALSQQNKEHLKQAASVYEYLLDQTSFPRDLRIEAGLKWGLSLTKAGNRRRAKQVYARVIDQFLRHTDNNQRVGSTGRYWLSRALFSLAELLEADGAFQEAQKLYGYIFTYDLPGQGIAQEKTRE